MKKLKTLGMTLIEILITLAILGLLAGALLLFMRPDDDRKCRNEAERLASWMQSTVAEAGMRDQPVRAAVDLDLQKVTRELASFDSMKNTKGSSFSWKEAEKTEVFTPRNKVQMTLVATVAIPETKSGTVWLVFEGNRSRGGVIVMELNKAVYSVVIWPSGEVKVEPGRAKPKDGAQQNKKLLWDIESMGLSGDGTLDLSNIPIGQGETPSEKPSTPATPKSKANPKKPQEETPPSDPPHEEPQPPEMPPQETPPPEEPPEDPEDPEDPEEPDAGEEHECERNEDCEGLWRVCRQSDHTCVIDPSNHAFRLYSVQITQPPAMQQFLSERFNREISDERYNLVLKLGEPHAGEVGEDQPYWGWTVQAQRAGNFGGMSAYVPHGEMPAFRDAANPMNNSCPQGFDVCYQFISMDQDDGQPKLDLYLPYPRSSRIPENQCQYQKLTVVATLQAYIKIGNIPGGATAQFELTGVIREKDARKLEVQWASLGGLVSLYTVMTELGIKMNADSMGDGQPDAWRFSFTGPAYEVSLLGEPYNQLGAKPPNCK